MSSVERDAGARRASSLRPVWREMLLGLDSQLAFTDPASAADLRNAERALGLPIPTELASLLRESNGVSDPYGTGLIWALDRIVSVNATFRSSPDFAQLYMPFDSLLFFADAGNGDQFAFPITPAGTREDVFVWNHEDDSRRWYASSLEQYLGWWLSGDYPV